MTARPGGATSPGRKPATEAATWGQRTSIELFPAALRIGDVDYSTARAFVDRATGRMRVWWQHPETGPLLIVDGVDLDEPAAGEYRATTPDGELAVVTKQRGCGCHHPMKRWRPSDPWA